MTKIVPRKETTRSKFLQETSNRAQGCLKTPQREGLSRSIIPKRYQGFQYTMTVDIVVVHLGTVSV